MTGSESIADDIATAFVYAIAAIVGAVMSAGASGGFGLIIHLFVGGLVILAGLYLRQGLRALLAEGRKEEVQS